MMDEVILLNHDYTFLSKVSIKSALRYIVKGKVEIIKYSSEVIRTCEKELLKPLVLRLVYLVRSVYKRAVVWTKRNVMVRDNFECVYCGSKNNLNIDHVIPRSKGGSNTFDNTVAACKTCNNKKGDLLLKEAGLFFRKGYRPYQPTISEFISKYQENLGILKLLKELGIY